ncbi:hypothetical protein CNMCM8980_005209 [Aspergillus fumigatiaffinis]|nr:hypothetical protein CNMCM8980_005209 [Aspergillus fumigatiaffinis]
MLSIVVETELETRDEERKPLLTLLDAGNDLAEKLEEWFSPLSFSAIALSGAAGDDYGAHEYSPVFVTIRIESLEGSTPVVNLTWDGPAP